MNQLPQSAGPGVSIVIPTWNGLELLQRFLPSVLRAAAHYCSSGPAAVELLVVDDGSTDATVDWLRAAGFTVFEPGAPDADVSGRLQLQDRVQPDLIVVQNAVNIGFSGSCNRAVCLARHPIILLLNNDVEVDEDVINRLVGHFEDDRVFAVHCQVRDYETGAVCGAGQRGRFRRGFIRVHDSYGALDIRGSAPLYSVFASGGSAAFCREKLLALGRFEELLAPSYWEDVEIGYRAWKRGYTVLYEPGAQVRHRVSSTMRRLNRRRVWRIQQRNRLIFHWINLHDRRLFLAHVAWVAVLFLTAPVRLQPSFCLAVVDAVGRLKSIRRRRAEELGLAKRSDRDVFLIFDNLIRNLE